MENDKVRNGADPEPGPVGRWTIKQTVCTTCCECIDACRLGLLAFVAEAKVIVINKEYLCTQCGDCADICGYNAIVLT